MTLVQLTDLAQSITVLVCVVWLSWLSKQVHELRFGKRPKFKVGDRVWVKSENRYGTIEGVRDGDDKKTDA